MLKEGENHVFWALKVNTNRQILSKAIVTRIILEYNDYYTLVKVSLNREDRTNP